MNQHSGPATTKKGRHTRRSIEPRLAANIVRKPARRATDRDTEVEVELLVKRRRVWSALPWVLQDDLGRAVGDRLGEVTPLEERLLAEAQVDHSVNAAIDIDPPGNAAVSPSLRLACYNGDAQEVWRPLEDVGMVTLSEVTTAHLAPSAGAEELVHVRRRPPIEARIDKVASTAQAPQSDGLRSH